MIFCPKCEAFCLPDYSKKQSVCSKCGDSFDLALRKEQKNQNILEQKIFVVNRNAQKLNHFPRGKHTCSKCGNLEVYISIVASSAEERDTAERYQCTKCMHAWRERK